MRRTYPRFACWSAVFGSLSLASCFQGLPLPRTSPARSSEPCGTPRARRPGRAGHADPHGHRTRASDGHRCGRRHAAPLLATGVYTVMAELRLQAGVGDRDPGLGRSGGPRRSEPGNRRALPIRSLSKRPTRSCAVVVGPGRDGWQGGDPDAAAQRPQLRQPDPHRCPACCAASPARTSTAPAAWPGAPRRRSRPTASGRATTTTCSTASTTTRPGCRRS